MMINNKSHLKNKVQSKIKNKIVNSMEKTEICFALKFVNLFKD